VTGDPLDIDRLPAPGAGFVWRTFGTALALVAESDAVAAVFTTRVGGRSQGRFATWNMSYAVGDVAARVAENRASAAACIGRDGAASWGRIRQVHGSDVLRWSPDGELRAADGVWSDDACEVVGVFGADCLPVLVTGRRGVAAAHAGWRGLIAGVVESAVGAVGGTDVWIGPGIGPCCYDVGDDAARPIRERFGSGALRGGKADLWFAAAAGAAAAGAERVHVAGLCTSCNAALFFSHRRDRGLTGRQCLVAALRDD
jgi:YfiH family protein